MESKGRGFDRILSDFFSNALGITYQDLSEILQHIVAICYFIHRNIIAISNTEDKQNITVIVAFGGSADKYKELHQADRGETHPKIRHTNIPNGVRLCISYPQKIHV